MAPPWQPKKLSQSEVDKAYKELLTGGRYSATDLLEALRREWDERIRRADSIRHAYAQPYAQPIRTIPVFLPGDPGDYPFKERNVSITMLGIENLKDLNTHNLTSLDEVVFLSTYVRTNIEGYQDLKLEPPKWLKDLRERLAKELVVRIESEREQDIKRLKAGIEDLRSREDKRKELEAKLAKLESQTVTIQRISGGEDEPASKPAARKS